MNMHYIDIGRDYGAALGGRYRKDGGLSGERFREDILEPAYNKYDMVVLILDTIKGYTASFFEESLGGLVRKYGLEAVKKKIKFQAIERAYLVPMIETYMKEAAAIKKHR